MKVVFDVEKRDGITGKRYIPNVEYEMSEEKAKAILNQSKYAHEVKKKVENVENVVENSEKPRKKRAKKD